MLCQMLSFVQEGLGELRKEKKAVFMAKVREFLENDGAIDYCERQQLDELAAKIGITSEEMTEMISSISTTGPKTKEKK